MRVEIKSTSGSGSQLQPDFGTRAAQLIRFVNDGVRVDDSFVRALLHNDLADTVRHASDDDLYALPAYLGYLRDCAPSICWGSVVKVEQWIKHHGGSAETA